MHSIKKNIVRLTSLNFFSQEEARAGNMAFTAESLQMLISHFYTKSNDPTEQMRAHSLLSQAQASPAAWGFVWDLMYLNKVSCLTGINLNIFCLYKKVKVL